MPFPIVSISNQSNTSMILNERKLKKNLWKMQFNGVEILKIRQPYQKIFAKTNFYCADALPNC